MSVLTSRRWLIALTAALLVGCASPPPPATPQTFANFNSQTNANKQISLEGYLRIPSSALVSDTMLVELYESADGKEKKGPYVPVSLKVGSGKNQVEQPPKNYTDKDLKVHCNDGTLIEAGQKVRVSAKLVYSPSSSILFAPVDIQKI